MYKLLQLLANEENVTLCSGVELTYLIHIPNQDLLIHSLPCHPCKSTNWFRDITTSFMKGSKRLRFAKYMPATFGWSITSRNKTKRSWIRVNLSQISLILLLLHFLQFCDVPRSRLRWLQNNQRSGEEEEPKQTKTPVLFSYLPPARVCLLCPP